MRDLAQLSLATGQPSRFGKILRLVVFALLTFGIIYFVGNQFLAGGGSSPIILQEAPRGLTPVDIGSSGIAGGGVDLVTQSANLEDVKYGGEAKATATRSFGGGIYKLSVDATLPDPKNVNYQVWLVSGENVLPIDYMRGAKTSWSLSLRSDDKYSGYGGIWITLERSKDEIPEEHVMEGSF